MGHQSENEACKRPYRLGERQVRSNARRAAILAAARRLLESNGSTEFTLDAVASSSGVTRQTVHNIFGTRSGLLEAVFDAIAIEGGMQRMPQVMMQAADANAMLRGFTDLFIDFWSAHRTLLRRVRAIAMTDADFAKVLEARNQRRRMGSERVIRVLDQARGRPYDSRRVASLYALTSFEFFDTAVEALQDEKPAAEMVRELIEKAVL